MVNNAWMVEASIPQFEFSAGSVCLDFVNTVWERPGYLTKTPAAPHELLCSVTDLEQWISKAEIFSKNELSGICRGLRENSQTSSRLLNELLALRECIFQAILSITSTRKLPAELLESLNEQYKKVPARVLSSKSTSLTTAFDEQVDDPRRIFNLISSDSLTILTTEDHSRLRICSADDCGWVFLDRSKAGKRRWCSMRDCGNRDKVTRFLERKRAAN